MKKILVDTSVIIDYTRRQDKEKSLFVKLAYEKYGLYISIITHTELYAGKSVWEKREAQHALETLLSGLNIISMSEVISKKAGEIRAKQNIRFLDAIIAATAIANSLDLVTLNTKDFVGIKGLRLYGKS